MILELQCIRADKSVDYDAAKQHIREEEAQLIPDRGNSLLRTDTWVGFWTWVLDCKFLGKIYFPNISPAKTDGIRPRVGRIDHYDELLLPMHR